MFLKVKVNLESSGGRTEVLFLLQRWRNGILKRKFWKRKVRVEVALAALMYVSSVCMRNGLLIHINMWFYPLRSCLVWDGLCLQKQSVQYFFYVHCVVMYYENSYKHSYLLRNTISVSVRTILCMIHRVLLKCFTNLSEFAFSSRGAGL